MIKLDPWQIEVDKHPGDLLLCTGRRVGKTYILAKKAVDEMAKKRGMPVIIMSLTEDQAMIIMSMALNYAKERYLGLIGKGKFKPTLKTMHLNGGKMIVRPMGATGDGARGFEGGILIVDEASRAPKMFWIAALPILLTTNGRIWMGSTPFKDEGYFWKCFDEAYNKKSPHARFKVFHITTPDAINNRPISSSWTQEQKEGALRILKEARNEMTEEEYKQEYLGLFSSEIKQFFPEELIDELCVLDDGEIEGGKNYMGIDCAGLGKDKNSFEIVKRISKEEFIHIKSITTTKQLTTQTSAKAIELTEQYNLKGIGVDDGGVGFGVFSELLNHDKTKGRVKRLNNSSRATDRDERTHTKLLKEEMYIGLKVLMEHRRIKLLNKEDVKLSLRSVQWEVIHSKETGLTRTRIHGKDTHIAEGLIRAVQMATEDKTLNLFAI